LVRVTVGTSIGERSVAGTLFGNAAPRLVEIFGIKVEAELEGEMIYIVNDDGPAYRPARLPAGRGGVNIGTFNLGRRAAGEEAVR
jgi:D-3-phosphoglycerate dehydrogenase